MSLPPRGFGARGAHAILVRRRITGGFAALVDGRPLTGDFESEPAARAAAAAEVLRLAATQRALLVRVRRGLLRKLA